jgi:hypothetical protein
VAIGVADLVIANVVVEDFSNVAMPIGLLLVGAIGIWAMAQVLRERHLSRGARTFRELD